MWGQETLRFLTAALQEVEHCWATQTSSNARACTCVYTHTHTKRHAGFFYVYVGTERTTHIKRHNRTKAFLSACVCVVLWLFLFKHTHVLDRPPTGHSQDRYDHYAPRHQLKRNFLSSLRVAWHTNKACSRVWCGWTGMSKQWSTEQKKHLKTANKGEQ